MASTTPSSLNDDALLLSLASVLRDSRRTEADLLEHIAEVDRRQLYMREACSSMFAYCVERLHLSEPEAALRIHAARACRLHPALLDKLREGRLHLSGIALLAPHLKDEKAADVLRQAEHRTKAQLRELVARLAPRADVPTVIRQLPASRRRVGLPMAELPMAGLRLPELPMAGLPTPAGLPIAELAIAALPMAQVPATGSPIAGLSTAALPTAMADMGKRVAAPVVASASGDAHWAANAPSAERAHRLDDVARSGEALPVQSASPPRVAPAPSRRERGTVEPLSPARYKFQFTGSAVLKQKLERLQALMLGSVPDGDLAVVIEAAVTKEIDRLEAKRLGATKAPRRSVEESDTRPGPRHIPAAVKRAVRLRDGDRCAYVDRQGNRCSERRRLQFHHRHPHGMGGDRSPENISLRCRWHNGYEAEQDFGRSFARDRAGSRAEALRTGGAEPASTRPAASP
jgi:hypothetical protein